MVSSMKFTSVRRQTVFKRIFIVLWFVTPIAVSLFVLSKARNENDSMRPSCCGPKCRVRTKDRPTQHYDESYFKWQTELGLEKAKERDWQLFMEVNKQSTVGDLGAGGGHILASLDIKKRIAVEVNGLARLAMEKIYPGKINAYEYPEDVPDNTLDLLFSTSAIEHFECPLTELREMAKKVKVGGRILLGIKNEGLAIGVPVNANDKNQHIYTWNFQELHNLITMAGFKVTEFEPSRHYTMEVHAKRLKYPQSFTSHDSDIYIWIKGVKPAASNSTTGPR